MTEQEFEIHEQSPHPMNVVAYRLDVIPGARIEDGGIDNEEAIFWAEELHNTGWLQMGSIVTRDQMSIGDMLRYAETGEQKRLIQTGEYIPGPLVLNGKPVARGIGLWSLSGAFQHSNTN